MGGRDKILYNQLRLGVFAASKELCILNEIATLSSSESNLKIECI
jgi:hypothetical protein